MKLLLPRLLLLHDSNGRLYRSSGDKGNCRGSSKSSCSSALLLSDAANTLLLLLLLFLLWLEQPSRLPNDEVCSLIKTMNHQVQALWSKMNRIQTCITNKKNIVSAAFWQQLPPKGPLGPKKVFSPKRISGFWRHFQTHLNLTSKLEIKGESFHTLEAWTAEAVMKFLESSSSHAKKALRGAFLAVVPEATAVMKKINRLTSRWRLFPHLASSALAALLLLAFIL